jgi:hypothetical protein
MTNSENYSIHTTRSSKLHLPKANLATYQKGASYLDVKKIFNNLPSDNKKTCGNFNKFKRILKHYFTTHTF